MIRWGLSPAQTGFEAVPTTRSLYWGAQGLAQATAPHLALMFPLESWERHGSLWVLREWVQQSAGAEGGASLQGQTQTAQNLTVPSQASGCHGASGSRSASLSLGSAFVKRG